jgi:hypothetical protein
MEPLKVKNCLYYLEPMCIRHARFHSSDIVLRLKMNVDLLYSIHSTVVCAYSYIPGNEGKSMRNFGKLLMHQTIERPDIYMYNVYTYINIYIYLHYAFFVAFVP